MAKRNLDGVKFVELKDLKENRFSFVENKVLRENIAIQMQYIVFLVSLEEEYELPGAVTYSTFKTIIIFTAAIVESLINYKLHEMVECGRCEPENIFENEEKDSDEKLLYKISESEKIIALKRVIKPGKLTDESKMIELNRAAKRCGLLTEPLFKKAEAIRTMRNKIHPFALKKIDDQYSKADINEVFKMTAEIVKRIENY